MVIPGNGDFTFQSMSVTMLTPGETTVGVAIGDLNRDGKPDIVAANHDSASLTIFLNHGGFAFDTTTVSIDRQANDVVLADLNHDGKLDLLVATSTDGGDGKFSSDGYVYTILGSGTGGFAAPVKYRTARGAWRIVVGDFNRDNILDVATGNRSAVLGEEFCGLSSDSVSILPGTTAGTFGTASSFSLGNQANPDDSRFHGGMQTLAVGDVNGDSQPDLVASNGAILINQPPDPNWAPTVSVGPDRAADSDGSVQLKAIASDVDQDLLTYSWTESGGAAIEPTPEPCRFTPSTKGVHTFTVTVDDGHGHTASDSVVIHFGGGSSVGPTVSSFDEPSAGDVVPTGQPMTVRWSASNGSTPIARFDLTYSLDDGHTVHPIAECQSLAGNIRACEWNDPQVSEQARVIVTATDTGHQTAFRMSDRFAVRTVTGTTLGNGWSHADVGAVGAPGGATYDGLRNNGDSLTVTGSGADIWGTADEFHFAWKHMTGDFSIETRVDSLQNTNAWAKAGLMIRADATDAASIQASIFVSPSKGLAYQRRGSRGGAMLSIAGPALTAPIWLRMMRQGNIITSSYRKNLTDAWTPLAMQTLAALASPVDVGLAVTSHADGVRAAAVFSGAYLAELPHLAPLAMGGASGGSSGGGGTTYEMNASGRDIWGTSDSFVFAAVDLGDNRQITARVRILGNTNAWAKAGVMIRDSNLATAKHADAVGVAVQGNCDAIPQRVRRPIRQCGGNRR